MDINQFEWDILERPSTFWQATLKHMLVLAPLYGGLSYLAYTFSYSQRYVKSSEVFTILEIGITVSVVVILLLWFRINQSLPQKLIHFKLNQDGLRRNRKKISLAAFNNPSVEEVLTKYSLPYQQWRQPRPPDGRPLELTFATNEGKIVIAFPEEYIKQKFIRTLQEYLHPSINQSQ